MKMNPTIMKLFGVLMCLSLAHINMVFSACPEEPAPATTAAPTTTEAAGDPTLCNLRKYYILFMPKILNLNLNFFKLAYIPIAMLLVEYVILV